VALARTAKPPAVRVLKFPDLLALGIDPAREAVLFQRIAVLETQRGPRRMDLIIPDLVEIFTVFHHLFMVRKAAR
jgi:hypothetical protein